MGFTTVPLTQCVVVQMCGAVPILCCAVLCCAHAGAQEQAVMMANATKAVVREQMFKCSLPVTTCARKSLNCHVEEQLMTSF